MLLDKEIYGLKNRGEMFHEKFAQSMITLSFTPSYAAASFWMKYFGSHL